YSQGKAARRVLVSRLTGQQASRQSGTDPAPNLCLEEGHGDAAPLDSPSVVGQFEFLSYCVTNEKFKLTHYQPVADLAKYGRCGILVCRRECVSTTRLFCFRLTPALVSGISQPRKQRIYGTALLGKWRGRACLRFSDAVGAGWLRRLVKINIALAKPTDCPTGC